MTITTAGGTAGAAGVITPPVNSVFQVTLLRNAKALCPYFEGTTSAEISEHQGTFTAKWRRIENLTVPSSALTELTGTLSFPTRNADQPTVTDITATVAKFGNFIYLTEEVDLVNFGGQTDKLIEVLGINAGQALNRQQRNEAEDNLTPFLVAVAATTATAISGGSTASGDIKVQDIATVVNALQRNDAMKFTPMSMGSTNVGSTPVRPAFIGIHHVDVEEDVRAIGTFLSAESYGSHVQLYNGEYGMVGGVRFISTSEGGIDAGNGTAGTGSATAHGRAATSGRTDIYSTVVYGKDCLGSVGFGFEHVKNSYQAGDTLPGVQLIQHARGSAGSADPLNEVGSLGWKSWHVAKVLNGNYGRTMVGTVNRIQSAE